MYVRILDNNIYCPDLHLHIARGCVVILIETLYYRIWLIKNKMPPAHTSKGKSQVVNMLYPPGTFTLLATLSNHLPLANIMSTPVVQRQLLLKDQRTRELESKTNVICICLCPPNELCNKLRVKFLGLEGHTIITAWCGVSAYFHYVDHLSTIHVYINLCIVLSKFMIYRSTNLSRSDLQDLQKGMYNQPRLFGVS